MSDELKAKLTLLDAKIPRDVIKQREGGGKFKLDYLEGWYVIARLNEVFGQGNWEYASQVEKLYEGVVQGKFGDSYYTSYSAQVTLSVMVDPEFGTKATFTDYGFGDGSDKNNPGKAHELAIKEAVTDGIKRCAKNLGMSFGLALYDKSREFVEDENEQPKASRTIEPSKPAVNSATSAPVATKKEEPVHAQPEVSNKVPEDKTKERIKATWDILIKKGRVQPSDAKNYLSKFSVSRITELNTQQASTFLGELSQLL